MSKDNIQKWFERVDNNDVREGKLAYVNYNKVMLSFSNFYNVDIRKVTAVFVALSPNNSYDKNIRSLATVLDGFVKGTPLELIKVSTYKHCRDRAYSYLAGVEFDQPNRGLKILSFYKNILNPSDKNWVTVDGHIKALYVDQELTMKEALVGKREYREIDKALKEVACEKNLIPNQLQAILWFTRKRVLGINYTPQLAMFGQQDDKWNTLYLAEEVIPYDNYKKMP